MATRLGHGWSLVLAVVLGAAGCDRAQLLAPTGSTVRLMAASQGVPLSGTTVLTAYVLESSGTPVQNGTTVRFTTNLGRLEPQEAQTTDGYATTTFIAGTEAGVAEVRAFSGAAGSGDDAESSLVLLTVGAAAVETVLLGANPASVPANGGTVTLLATVIGGSGQALPGVPVTFVSSAGQLSASAVETDAAGQARTTLTTNTTASVTASAGTKTSSTVSVTVAPAVTATLTAVADAVVSGVGHRWTFTANVAGGTGAPQPTAYDWTFGDGTATTTNGNTTAHVYGPSTESSARIVRVVISLTGGDTVVATTEILIGDIVP